MIITIKTKDILNIVLLFFSVLFLSACVTPTENINSRGALNIHNNKSTYELIEQGPNFRLYETKDGLYYYEIFDMNKNIVEADEINKYPYIEMINDDLLLFRLQAGTGLSTQWGYFYDPKKNIFSDNFSNIFDIRKENVIFAEHDKVIVQNIFDSAKFRYEITDFWNPLANTTEPFNEVIFVDDTHIKVSYLTGDDYQIAEQIFLIDPPSGTISNMYDVHNVIPEYDRLERSGTEFELGVIFADNIQWLSLSYIGYEKEQNMIKNYEQEDFKAINEINPNAKPTIAVGKFDINNDGIDEMIAFLGGTAHWGGAHSTGAISVYFLTDNVITQSISLPGFDIDTDHLENSHQIGVILKEEGTMDFFIMNRLFVWNGNGWG